jgi:hypothetical protein
MRHLRVIAASLVIILAGMIVVPSASSQISIRLRSGYRDRHHVYYHPRHAPYYRRHVVYYHRHAAYRHRDNGVRLRLNVR